MRILMLTQLFQPEPNHLKGLAFAKELTRLGHSVEVLTGFPNYPRGRLYPGYRQKWRMREVLDGISIVRVPLYPDHSSSGFRRFLCYGSLALTAFLPGVFLVRKPDVIHVYQGPATLVFPAMMLRVCFGVPYVLDIQDIWPDSVLSSGMLRSPVAAFLLNRWCCLAYRLASKIVVLSPGYKSALVERGVPSSKIEVVYNWCEETRMLRSRSSEGGDDPFGLSGRFNVVYAGNLGRVQALDAVVQAAGLLSKKCPNVQFVFVGDGVDTERLKCKVTDDRMVNIKFISRQPIDKVGAILSRADALLIHLRDDPLCRIGIPQKTQAYLAAGRPIIMAVRGDATNLVQQANAGIVCEPENAASIADAVERLLRLPSDMRRDMARNGRDFYDKHLSFSVGLNRMIAIFSGVVQ